MDKSIQVAVKKYPHGTFDGEIGDSLRAACAVGYMQAKKDLALTGEDIRNISKILHQLEAEDWCLELIFDEAARIFNEQREKK